MRKFAVLYVFTLCLLSASCSLTVPIAATSNAVGGKTGTAAQTTFLGINVGGEASARAAAAAGGITRIATVDLKRSSFLGIVTTHTCIVTGE